MNIQSEQTCLINENSFDFSIKAFEDVNGIPSQTFGSASSLQIVCSSFARSSEMRATAFASVGDRAVERQKSKVSLSVGFSVVLAYGMRCGGAKEPAPSRLETLAQ